MTAGGKGSRIKQMEGEKPLIPVLGIPMIDRVLEAVMASSGVGAVLVSITSNTPRTEEHLRKRGIDVIITDGRGYSEDLNQAMSGLATDQVMVLPADMPLIRPETIEEVLRQAEGMKVGSFCVTVPVELMRALGLNLTYSLTVDGREVVLCGVSVVDRKAMLTGLELEQSYMISESEELALNVNTVGDLRRAEMVLTRRLAP
ncbi:MAG: NTP transferase domain-containing protein [Methanomassiliicoccus sp.]|nr:NTP transferase domain-containing protein [Methanomassiliicoccus sp.]